MPKLKRFSMLYFEFEGPWMWGRFCKETGYAHNTPYKWFEKYGLPITQTRGPEKLKKFSLDKPLKSHTKPEVKII